MEVDSPSRADGDQQTVLAGRFQRRVGSVMRSLRLTASVRRRMAASMLMGISFENTQSKVDGVVGWVE